jgi:uncharacterized protein (UPF0276 family)
VTALRGAGLGLRRGLFTALADAPAGAIDFFEVAPENWIRTGGRLGRRFQWFSERYPLVCHGLSLSLGGPAPLDVAFLREIKSFLERFGVHVYTEHLSACGDEGQLYDLLPIPFTEEAVEYVAGRIRQVQDVLERRIGIEHVSYYAAPSRAMTELEFVNAVVERADCGLLLDVNNLYVNSVNFGYDPVAFLEALPGERITYVHVAGHHVEAPDLRIDTHASDVSEPVWDLLARAYARFGVLPTLLERDFNYPPLPVLLGEVERIRTTQRVVGALS